VNFVDEQIEKANKSYTELANYDEVPVIIEQIVKDTIIAVVDLFMADECNEICGASKDCIKCVADTLKQQVERGAE